MLHYFSLKVNGATYQAVIRAIGGESYCNDCMLDQSNHLKHLQEQGLPQLDGNCYLPKPANEILSSAVIDNIETEAEQSSADITLQHLEDNDDEAVNFTSQDVAEYLGKENYDITESPLVNVVSDFHQV